MYNELCELYRIEKNKDIGKNIFYLTKMKKHYDNIKKQLLFQLNNTENNNLYNLKNKKLIIKTLEKLFTINSKPILCNEKNLSELDYRIKYLELDKSMKERIDLVENDPSLLLLILLNNYISEKDLLEKENFLENLNNGILTQTEVYLEKYKTFIIFFNNLTQYIENEFFVNQIHDFQDILEDEFEISDEYLNQYINSFDEIFNPFFKTIEKLFSEYYLEKKKFYYNKDIEIFRESLFELTFDNMLFIKSMAIKEICKKVNKMIIIEAADKLGKTTFCDDIVDQWVDLKDELHKIFYYHFPTEKSYEIFPKLNNTEYRQLGFSTETLFDLKKLLRKVLDNNNFVICDRAILSGIVYSSLDFKDSIDFDYFYNTLQYLYQKYFDIEVNILNYVNVFQFVIVTEEPEKLHLVFDSDDVIEKDFDKEKWMLINNTYKRYIDSSTLMKKIPLFDKVKHYKIIYDNDSKKDISAKRSERLRVFLNRMEQEA